MKKILFVFSLVITTAFVFGQQVDRDKVLVEIGTGTWCTYCPGAAMGADDLVSNGHPVAIIEYHNGDPFANAASNARNTYYSISGFPTAFFDGVTSVVGGSHSQSMYNSYLPHVQNREAVPSDFIVNLYGTHNGAMYDMTAIIQHVGTYSGPNPKFHLAVTESDIAYSWQGQSELNFVLRHMVPDQNGTDIDLSQGDTIILELSFTMGGWNTAHVEFVPFLQNHSSKEVLQATKVSHFFLPPPPVAPETDFEAVATISCQGYEVQYTDISTNNPTSWSWHFPGGDPEYSTEENPLVTYAEVGSYDVTLYAANIMGSDEVTKADYMEIESTPDQPSISLSNFILESSSVDGNQWYRNDDLIAGATGQTYTPIYNGTYTVTVTQGNCTSAVSTGYEVMWVGINEAYNSESVKIYPTPNQGRFTLEINARTPDILSMKVYNTANAVVYEQEAISVNGAFKNQFDLGNLPNGIYFMVLEGEKENYLQKLVIQN